MLRKIRIALAAICFVLITMLFLDFTGTLHTWFGWLAKIQFLPAVLALNVAVIIVMVLLTLVLGRVYCSVICPLGVFQDIISWFGGRKKERKLRFSYSPEKKWLRYGVFVLFVLAIIFGINAFVALLAPYSAYGRIASNIFAPIYQWGNNLCAYFAARADSYAFYTNDVWLKSLPTFLIAAVTLVVLVILAWRNGRTYCNTICPVGTTLSFFSRFAAFRPMIDSDKCKNCRICERKCKSACINIKEHKIDYSRCVDCFDCLDNCKFGAMHYRFAYGKKSSPKDAPVQTVQDNVDTSRRAFLSSSAIIATALTVGAQEKKLDGGLATIIDKKKPKRKNVLTPFGSKSIKEFYDHCTACQLCVSVCPNEVLRPSESLEHLMQPEMSYERGYCRPECTKCSQVCPAGAILPITPEQKTAIHIGTAVVDFDLCVANKDGVSCGNCARHCPAGAIRMLRKNMDDPESVRIPSVIEDRCIGCGACENLCPARPYSAIHVDGLEEHRQDELS
jgi:ferredoxin